jgi:hypothetical protein
MTDFARHLVKKTTGAVATVYSCPFCKHHTVNRKGTRGQGRGHGLRTGGALHSQLAAHIRREHPAKLAKAAEVMALPRSFDYAGEAGRSDAMSDARRLAQELTKATGTSWTFHHQRAFAGQDRDYYRVTEAKR